MTHHIARFLLLALVFASVGVHAQEMNADIYGKWKIKAMIGGGIGSLTDQQARQLIGKSLTISAERFEFDGHICLNPNYQRSKEDPDTYFDREWRTDVSDIPFPKPMTIIEITDCDKVYPIRKDRLMVTRDGGFFEAVRVKSGAGKPIGGTAKKP